MSRLSDIKSDLVARSAVDAASAMAEAKVRACSGVKPPAARRSASFSVLNGTALILIASVACQVYVTKPGGDVEIFGKV